MEKVKTRKKPLSLMYKLLIWIIPIVIIYTAVLTTVNSMYIMSSTRSSLRKTLSETAEITATHIAESINNNMNLTKLLANRVLEFEDEIIMPYSELDVSAFEAKVAALGEAYGFMNMMVGDLEGYTRTVNHVDLVSVQAPYYTAIINDNKDIFVSDVTLDKGKFAGNYVLNFSVPIKSEEGKTIGVLICKANAAELSGLVSDISVGEDGSTFIIDNSGQCIAHKSSDMLFGGDAYSAYINNDDFADLNELFLHMTTDEDGYRTYTYNGSRIAAFCRIPGTNNWSIAVTVSESEFMQVANNAMSITIIISVIMIFLVLAVLVMLFVSVTGSMKKITARLEALANGDLKSGVGTEYSYDETYRLSTAAAKLIVVVQNLITDTEYALSEIANGNLTVKPDYDYPGDFSEIKTAIENNLNKLNNLVQRIARTSEEVARGSSQMASGASGLAQGASEQASSLEELFETVTSLTQRTYEIGGLDKKKLAAIEESETEDTEPAAQDTDKKPDGEQTLAEKLTIAISRIADASGTIRRIASDIESISSETGMLALNASVEATHAGDAGRGFSVIAAEIRNLSDKSRDAAKDADSKIDSISKAVNRGSQIVDITVSTIGEMTLAMSQVKSALEQISNVVENIAATAEETAAGSEELSAQADMLRSLVAEFRYNTYTDDK